MHAAMPAAAILEQLTMSLRQSSHATALVLEPESALVVLTYLDHRVVYSHATDSYHVRGPALTAELPSVAGCMRAIEDALYKLLAY